MRTLTVWLAWGLVLAGCDGTGMPEPSPEPEGEVLTSVCGADAEKTATVMSGAYTLSWQSEPDPIPLNEQFDLLVDVQGADGAAAGTVSLDADAAMPQHGHGMNTLPYVEPDEATPGRFVVDGMQLHMPGDWKLYLDLTVGDDGPTERATFDLTCVE